MKYSLKVWICTILSGSLLFMLFGALLTTEDPVSFPEGFFELGLLILLFSFMFSIPSLVIFWQIFSLLEERPIKIYIRKITLGLTGLFLICASFLMIDRHFFDRGDWSSLSFPASYSFALLFFIFFFKMPDTGNTSQVRNKEYQ